MELLPDVSNVHKISMNLHEINFDFQPDYKSMFEKVEILIIIFVFLLVFYLVISFGAGKKKFSKSTST